MDPREGTEGSQVTLFGSGFLGATQVTFNGTVADFQVDSDTELRTVAPPGATTGPIQVTGPGGTGSSPQPFQILPGGAGGQLWRYYFPLVIR